MTRGSPMPPNAIEASEAPPATGIELGRIPLFDGSYLRVAWLEQARAGGSCLSIWLWPKREHGQFFPDKSRGLWVRAQHFPILEAAIAEAMTRAKVGPER